MRVCSSADLPDQILPTMPMWPSWPARSSRTTSSVRPGVWWAWPMGTTIPVGAASRTAGIRSASWGEEADSSTTSLRERALAILIVPWASLNRVGSCGRSAPEFLRSSA